MKPAPPHFAGLPVLFHGSQRAWEAWLNKNGASSKGLWLRIAKKDSGIASVTYEQALESALCHGWIDGQKQSLDDETWLQKFTPRGPKSIWSKRNRAKVEALAAAGRMKAAGLKAVAEARRDGRWDAAYDSQNATEMPEDFLTALGRNRSAAAFFATLNSANRYAILFRLQTAKKAETRARRIEGFLTMLERKEKLHP
jgi:uncharacterized protein YdeI (YjbR/CyaY-like superfamily)